VVCRNILRLGAKVRGKVLLKPGRHCIIKILVIRNNFACGKWIRSRDSKPSKPAYRRDSLSHSDRYISIKFLYHPFLLNLYHSKESKNRPARTYKPNKQNVHHNLPKIFQLRVLPSQNHILSALDSVVGNTMSGEQRENNGVPTWMWVGGMSEAGDEFKVWRWAKGWGQSVNQGYPPIKFNYAENLWNNVKVLRKWIKCS
jgi:hypothetical protein